MSSDNITKPSYVSETIDFASPSAVSNFLNNFKKAIIENNLDVVLYTMTHKQFIDIMSNWMHPPAIDNFATSIIRIYTNQDYTPRSYNFDIGDIPDYTGHINDKARFFCFNKLHSFLTTPFEHFRIPFSIGLNNGTMHIHPGNFRFMSMKFLPMDAICSVLITHTEENIKLIDYINTTQNFISKGFVFDYNDSELIDILRVNEYHYASVQISGASGLQVYEYHPSLKEYAQNYVIGLNNIDECSKTSDHFIKEITVNNIRVATLVDLGFDTRWVLPDKQVL